MTAEPLHSIDQLVSLQSVTKFSFIFCSWLWVIAADRGSMDATHSAAGSCSCTCAIGDFRCFGVRCPRGLGSLRGAGVSSLTPKCNLQVKSRYRIWTRKQSCGAAVVSLRPPDQEQLCWSPYGPFWESTTLEHYGIPADELLPSITERTPCLSGRQSGCCEMNVPVAGCLG